jgi:preprotein translocase subunit SecA
MTGRRWSDGLHQAVEAKEGVQIQPRTRPRLDHFQNYFRMYGKLSGMTGTAHTEAYEFQEIYGSSGRHPDRTARRCARMNSIWSTGPAAKSSMRSSPRHQGMPRTRPADAGRHHLDRELRTDVRPAEKAKLPHNVLNAKQHEQEAEIVAQAGRPA